MLVINHSKIKYRNRVGGERGLTFGHTEVDKQINERIGQDLRSNKSDNSHNTSNQPRPNSKRNKPLNNTLRLPESRAPIPQEVDEDEGDGGVGDEDDDVHGALVAHDCD